MKLIPLTRGFFAKVDDEDYDFLMQWKWHVRKNKNVYYAARDSKRDECGNHPKIHLHRVIMNTPANMMVDHKDFNGLNCQKNNMRNCTRSQNAMHSRYHRSISSKYFGVCYDKDRNKWMANLMFNKKAIHIGRFNTEIEAAKARDLMAIKYFGEYANLNQI